MSKYFKHYFQEKSQPVINVSLWRVEGPACAGYGRFESKCNGGLDVKGARLTHVFAFVVVVK